MRFAIVYFLIHMSILSYAQMRPLPAVLVASFTSDIDPDLQEPDVHNRYAQATKALTKYNDELLIKISEIKRDRASLDIERAILRGDIEAIKEQRRLEKKIAGIAGIILFASGNEMLKNVGLVSLFCYSIW